jgi:hypothetical protein
MATWNDLFDALSRSVEEARKRQDFAALAAVTEETTVLWGRYREAGRPDADAQIPEPAESP